MQRWLAFTLSVEAESWKLKVLAASIPDIRPYDVGSKDCQAARVMQGSLCGYRVSPQIHLYDRSTTIFMLCF